MIDGRKVTHHKGFRIIACVLAMACVFSIAAIPASAANYKITNGNYYLNIWGNPGAGPTGRSCTLYNQRGGIDQNFTMSVYSGRWVLKTANYGNYAVNRNSGNGTAIIWPLSTGLEDSALRSDSTYQFVLTKYPNQPLCAGQGTYQNALLGFGGGGCNTWQAV